jgi:hypothetical protein
MQAMETYSTLLESGQPDERTSSTPDVRQFLMDLVATTLERETLPLEGAWRLGSETVRDLRSRHGYTPPGGWRGVASLAAGCDVLEASREEFEARTTPEALSDWSDAETRRRLVEAFTRRLVPPTTAAGLFILLGVHPAWGVHLAHASNRRSTSREETKNDRSRRERDLFPEETFRVVRRAVFGAMSATTTALRQLDGDARYSVDALAEWIECVCRQTRQRAEGELGEADRSGLAPFVDDSEVQLDGSNWRVIDFTTEDLLDSFLVPAGVARHFDDGTFRIEPEALADVCVGPFGVEQQHEHLTRLLSDDPTSRVA